MESISPSEEPALWKARAGFYKKIIERYADAIDDGERKTIPDLKSLVNPTDATVLGLRGQLLEKAGIAEYSFDRDFWQYAEAAFALVQSLSRIDSEIEPSFWMRPADIVELGAADAFDRAILLCSLLAAGDCETARVLVLELEGGNRHPVVVFYYREKQHLLDASQEAAVSTYSGSLEELLKHYSYEGKKVLKAAFEFNAQDYNEFE